MLRGAHSGGILALCHGDSEGGKPMHTRIVATLGMVAALVCWVGTLAQSQYPQPSQSQGATTASSAATQNPPVTADQSEPKAKPEKQKHWSGSLVDANCITKVMSQVQAGAAAGGPQRQMPHFVDAAPSAAAQAGQRPTGPGQGGVPQEPTNPQGRQNPGNYPDMTQSAQMAKATMMDQAAKQCTATASTQAFALVSGADVMKLDDQGNSKASEAVKGVEVQPGKKVKAKVTGTMEGETIKVAAVEVKGKRASQPPAGSPGR
jgi:hypothetical protein